MDILPDLERLDVVDRLQTWFSVLAIVFVGLMVVCEAAAHYLSSKKDNLARQPRFISARQRQTLWNVLNHLPKNKVGVRSTHNQEQAAFAASITSALIDVGWDVHLDTSVNAAISFPKDSYL